MATIKIFLASSEELKHERLVIAEQVANINRKLANQNITLRLVKWEYLDSSMGAQHKQDEYNDKLVDCDMCFALFWTKFGMYTEIEFEQSLRELNTKGSIRHLSVLFKESATKSDELNTFEKKCTEEHPSLCHTFNNDDTLKELFNAEIERFLSNNSQIEKEKDDKNDAKSFIHTVRIFLSTDKALEQERLELSDLVENLNHSLEGRNANILMLAWDNSEKDDNDFDEEISKADLWLNIYYTNINNTIQAELDSAYQALCKGKNPKKIYVYFKDGDTIPIKLQKFRDSFPTKYGHFYCSYANIDTLKADFLLQFIEYQSKNIGDYKMFEINNGKVTLDGKEYVDLKNVPFAGNNEEYNLLLKSIKNTKKLLAITNEDDEEYADYAAELQKLQEKLSKMENSLWETALMITRLSTTKCSDRLKRAMDLFSAGDNKGANAILDEVDINKDIEHNINLIKLGNEGKMGLMTNIEEILLKIKTLENSQEPDWLGKTENLYKNIINIAKSNLSKEVLYNILDSYSISLRKVRRYSSSIDILNKMVEIGIQENNKDVFIRLGEAYCWISDAKKSDINYDRAIEIDENDIHTKIRCLVGKANNYFRRDKDRSEELYLEALKLQEKHLTSTTERLFYAQILNNLANIYSYKQNFAESKELHLKALKIRREYEDTDLEESRNLVTYTLKNLGDLYFEQKEYAKAEKAYKEATEIKRELANKKPYIHNSHLAMCLNVYGKLKTIREEYEIAEVLLKEALAIRRTLAKHERKGYINYVARTLDNLGHLYTVTGRYNEAEKLLLESLSIRKEMCSYCKEEYLDELKNCIQHVKYNYSCSAQTEAIVSYEEIVNKL